MQPDLTIFIPTYNRAKALDYCLRNLEPLLDEKEITHEIVVSDNGSTDDTQEVLKRHAEIKPHLSFSRLSANKPFLDNYENAVRHARGKYCLYLADDDQLVLPTIVEFVKTLKANPRLVAISGDMVAYDDVQKQTSYGYQAAEKSQTLSLRQPDKLLDSIVIKGYYPEIMMMNTQSLQESMKTSFTYRMNFAHDLLLNLLEHGDVQVEPKPFYYEVVNFLPELGLKSQDRANIRWEIEHPDWIRSSLEGVAHRLLLRIDGDKLTSTLKKDIQKAINRQSGNRYMVVANKNIGQHDYMRAIELYRRGLYILNQQIDPQQAVTLMIQASVQQVGKTALSLDRSKVRLVGFSRGFQIINAFLVMYPNLDVAETDMDSLQGDLNLVVLTRDQAQKQALIEKGVASGFIFCFEEVQKAFKLLPKGMDIQYNF